MARRSARNRSDDDADPSVIALEAPKRIYELKKERDERAKAIVAEAEKALASVRQQAVAYREEKYRTGAIKQAQNLERVMNLVEKRKQIEARMLEVIVDVHSAMEEVEEMIVAGYEGRRNEARQSLEALSDHPRYGKE